MNTLAFTSYMWDVLKVLEKSLNAPKDSLVFYEVDQRVNNGHVYSDVKFPARSMTFCIGFRTDWPPACEGYRFLLNLAAREVRDIVCDSGLFRLTSNGNKNRWAFNPAGHRWHTPETFANQIYERICSHVFTWLRSCLGLDPFSLSHIVDMNYETDAASGRIIFHTGALADYTNVYKITSSSSLLVDLCMENTRFIRKQLAGAGKNALLFVRKSADSTANYSYEGYIAPPNGNLCLDDRFLSVQLKRDGNWILYLNDRPILHVRHRDVFLPSDELSAVRENIDREFGTGTAAKLSIVLDALHKQRHGTSVIFLNMNDPSAQEMMNRLYQNGRALRIENMHIDGTGGPDIESILESISRVDGAFVCDLQSMCILFVNVLVDGLALAPGRSDCGARHNALESAIVNLTHNAPKTVRAVAVIFSEDGGISSISASECRTKLQNKTAG
ncbi:MAG: hypothetical protein K2O18_04220 [Oscillospiraceae bacterium]|nr:hypothetical protein [Oscillospiraceae bacterium]